MRKPPLYFFLFSQVLVANAIWKTAKMATEGVPKEESRKDCGGCEGDFTSHFTECFLEGAGFSSKFFLNPVKGSFERLQ